MARVMTVGDTWPTLYGEASDETGVLDLSGTVSLQFRMKSGITLVTGSAVADWPAIPDADDEHFWNWHYVWQTSDTAVAGVYQVELKVTWASNEIQTFGGDTLTVVAAQT